MTNSSRGTMNRLRAVAVNLMGADAPANRREDG
jgi:hypothetical protein